MLAPDNPPRRKPRGRKPTKYPSGPKVRLFGSQAKETRKGPESRKGREPRKGQTSRKQKAFS